MGCFWSTLADDDNEPHRVLERFHRDYILNGSTTLPHTAIRARVNTYDEIPRLRSTTLNNYQTIWLSENSVVRHRISLLNPQLVNQNRIAVQKVQTTTQNRVAIPKVQPVIQNRIAVPKDQPTTQNRIPVPKVQPTIQNRIAVTKVQPTTQNRIAVTKVQPTTQNRIAVTKVQPTTQNRIAEPKIQPTTQNRIAVPIIQPASQNRITIPKFPPATLNRLTVFKPVVSQNNILVSKLNAESESSIEGPRYGEYKCNECGRFWHSRLCWPNKYQNCKRCKKPVYAHTHRELQPSDMIEDKDAKREHVQDLCQMCITLGYYCKNYNKVFRNILYNSKSKHD